MSEIKFQNEATGTVNTIEPESIQKKMEYQSQVQNQKQAQLQFLDNGIHRLIIALERLEIFLAMEKQQNPPAKLVAVKTDRDLHDDKNNPPTRQVFYTEELHLQLLNTSKQGRFTGYMDGANKHPFEDEKEMIDSSASYFLNDILEWYSSRANEEPNDLERFAVPIIAAIVDKSLVANDINTIFFEYVGDWSDDYLSTISEEDIKPYINYTYHPIIDPEHIEKIKERMDAWKRWVKDGESNMNIPFTSHNRGDAKTGYFHLKMAFVTLFPDDKGKVAVLLLEKHTKRLCPKLYESIVEHNDQFKNQL